MNSRLVASLAALAVAVGVAACGHGASPASIASADASVSVATQAGTPAAGGTTAAARAFGGQGRLAFMSDDTLYALDGAAAGRPATLHAVPAGKAAGQTPGSPAWSPDGRWLAFLVGSPSADGAVTSGALWLAGPDGQGAHQVLPKVDGFAWSPTTDELAATSGYDGKLFAVRPGKPTYPMLEVPGLFDGAPAWSPNGRELAVATVTLTTAKRFASVIDLFVPSEGIVVNSLASSRTNALIVDGWWASGEGLLAWSDPRDSSTAAANGLPLVSYALDGPTVTLGRTLPYPSFAPPTGAGVALVTGGDRYPWSAKTIRYCSVSGQCGPMNGALPGPANLDPASSTWKGEPAFAFAHCATEPTEPTDTTKSAEGASQQSLTAWYGTCKLYDVAGAGGNALPVTRAGTGVAAPTMSAGTSDILYVRDNALWLISTRAADGAPSAAAPTPVVGRLFAGNWPAASGYTAWRSQFAWFS
jgi:WD40-like Beta Propeller Repeat